jgi:hypothetical protein
MGESTTSCDGSVRKRERGVDTAVEELEEGGATAAVGHGEGGELVLRESWELVNKEKKELEDVPVVKQKEKR